MLPHGFGDKRTGKSSEEDTEIAGQAVGKEACDLGESIQVLI